jgi:hypothetical protein
MAQIATTHDKKTAEQPRTGADRVADLARDAGDQGRKLAHDVAETTSSMVERAAANTVAAAEQIARSVPVLGTPPELGNDFADFWRELASAQLADNLDAFSKLAAARTWQERMSVQGSYISGSIARMGEVASRWLQLTGALATRQLTTGSREPKTAR